MNSGSSRTWDTFKNLAQILKLLERRRYMEVQRYMEVLNMGLADKLPGFYSQPLPLPVESLRISYFTSPGPQFLIKEC